MGESASSAFHLIRSLQVKGGFLDGAQVRFDPSLNCIIEGRGTGKTTVLEILRWALTGQIEACVRDLRGNAAEIPKTRAEVTELKERVSLLPEVTERLKTYKLDQGSEEAKALQSASDAKARRGRAGRVRSG